jgi:hypothetical protein
MPLKTMRPFLDDGHAPAAADAVLIDLELGLDQTVVELGLQLPGAGTGARAGPQNLAVAVVPAECGGGGDEQGGRQRERDERELAHFTSLHSVRLDPRRRRAKRGLRLG